LGRVLEIRLGPPGDALDRFEAAPLAQQQRAHPQRQHRARAVAHEL
jgi:hypothetical protein